MENIIYNKLLIRDYNVDVGIVSYTGKKAEGKRTTVRSEVDLFAISEVRDIIFNLLLQSSTEKKWIKKPLLLITSMIRLRRLLSLAILSSLGLMKKAISL